MDNLKLHNFHLTFYDISDCMAVSESYYKINAMYFTGLVCSKRFSWNL